MAKKNPGSENAIAYWLSKLVESIDRLSDEVALSNRLTKKDLNEHRKSLRISEGKTIINEKAIQEQLNALEDDLSDI